MGRYHMKTTILLAASVLWSIGCNRDKDDGGDGLGEGDGNYEGLDAGDSDYDDTGAWEDWEDDEPIRGSISGTVTVELYIENDDGDREYMSMEEAYGTTFPFGAIWVYFLGGPEKCKKCKTMAYFPDLCRKVLAYLG